MRSFPEDRFAPSQELDTAYPTDVELLACLAKFLPSVVAILCRDFPFDVAEDSAQEAVTRALPLIESGKAARHPNRKAWLVQVASNIARETIRRRRAHAAIDGIDVPARSTDEDVVADRRERLVAAIGTLPQPHRNLVACRYFEGNTPEETAARFGISVRTVCKRLAEARGMLAVAMARAKNACADSPLAH